MELDAKYLGDGVYIQGHPLGLMLTTGSHVEQTADNVIVLEPEVATQLYFVLQKLKTKTDTNP